MLSVEDWAEIGRLSKSESPSINEIVRRLGVTRNPVRAAQRWRRGARITRWERYSLAGPTGDEADEATALRRLHIHSFR